jgi:hypothetical protein
LLSLVLMGGVVGVVLAATAVDSPGKVQADTTTLNWTGQGTPLAQLCGDSADPGAGGWPDVGETPTNYLLWIFSTDGGSVSGTPTLTIDGTTYTNAYFTGGVWQIVTPGPIPSVGGTYASFTVASTGNGAWILTISHGCRGPNEEEPREHLTVTKTAVTSFDREHFWDISKKVETENGYTHEGYPKVWLYTDGRDDETATWTVDVTYEGSEDSGWNVSGGVTITNDGQLAAVINGYEDLLAGVDITGDLSCDFVLGDTLAVGDSFTCTYDEDVASAITGKNVFTVTTDRNLEPGYSGEAAITWGDPANETNKTVNVQDLSDLFGDVDLGSVTAPNDKQFTYTKDFSWADYGAAECGDYVYDNTASIVETGQSASARLKVNVQCMLSASAWAQGTGTGVVAARCFNEDGFSNWGWTNDINVTGDYSWTLWAGAAQCDTSKGFDAGTVSFDYSTITGNVTNIVYTPIAGVTFESTNTYSGTDPYPKLGKKYTTAPGQYSLHTSKTSAWVIAHAKVLYPDPNFGP